MKPRAKRRLLDQLARGEVRPSPGAGLPRHVDAPRRRRKAAGEKLVRQAVRRAGSLLDYVSAPPRPPDANG